MLSCFIGKRLKSNVNEFLNQIVDKPISLSKLGAIALDGKDEDIIGHGIGVKDTFNWKPQSSKPPYLSSDKKYTIIQEQFNLGFQKDLVWLKFTEDGYVGVVADSSDINYSYTNTAGRLLCEVNRTWDTSNLSGHSRSCDFQNFCSPCKIKIFSNRKLLSHLTSFCYDNNNE